jgi:glycosidase
MKRIVLLSVLILFSIALMSCEKELPKFYTSLDFLEEFPNHDNYYQIFVRSFADSNNDGIGDFNGIEQALPYLKELGITALWLTPFHPSNSYHGYGVTDYYDVHEDFGTLEDLTSLVNEARALQIDIMMDLVINHSSDQHPWYVDALANPNSKYRDYYYFNGANSAYQSFVGGLVDFDPRSEAFKEEVKRILDFYVDLGIRKFRLDAAVHFYDKPGLTGMDLNAGLYILYYNAYLKQTYGDDTWIVSEVFDYSDVRYANYLIGSDAVFNFYGMGQLVQKVGNQSSRFNFVTLMERFYNNVTALNPMYADPIFLSNHDVDRLRHRITNLDARKQTVKAMLTLPGSPFVYYGDELDMFGQRQEGTNVSGYGTAYDEFRRTAFLWGDERQTSWFPDNYNNDTLTLDEAKALETHIFHTYKTFLNLRLQHPALMFGDFKAYEGNDFNIQGYYRSFTHEKLEESLLVILNISSSPQQIDAIIDAEVIYGSYNMNAYDMLIVKLNR